MKQTVLIRCKNNGSKLTVETGSTLNDIYRASGLQMEYGPYRAR